METVFTPHYALILAVISAVFFGGGYVFLIKEQRQDTKDLKNQNQQIKDTLHQIQLEATKTTATLSNIQDQNRVYNTSSEREFETLRNRVSALENIKK